MNRIALLLALLLLPAFPTPIAAAPTPALFLQPQGFPGQPAPEQEAVDTSTLEVGRDRATLDREAEEALSALLERLTGTGSVSVTVESGLALLEGSAPSAEARDRAEEVARRIEGVAFVDNRIVLSTSVTDQLGPAVGRLEGRLGDLLALLPALGVALVAVILSLLLARGVGSLERPYAVFTRNPFAQNVLRQVARGLVVFGGVLVAVEILDITALVGAVVGTAGIAGIALGFAFKDIVENYLAGLLLSLRQPFAPNDTVELEGTLGKVVRLTSRETILMDLGGNHVRIPNATVFRSILLNYTRNPKRRFQVRLSVAPDEDLSRVIEVGLEALRGMRGVLEGPEPSALVQEIGDSSVTLEWYGWMDQNQSDFLKLRSEAIRLVLEHLHAAEVDMPPPEHRIRVVAEDGLAVVPGGTQEGAPGGVGPDAGAEGAGTASVEPAPDVRRSRPPAAQGDVSPDRTLDEQIDEDRRVSGEEDLLD